MNDSRVGQTSTKCITTANRFIFTAWFPVYLLFLPVFLLVLSIGFKKWRRPQSSAPGGGLSHSDVFTLNMAAMEMTGITGACVLCSGFFRNSFKVVTMGGNMVMTATVMGQMLFHSLTCVERYLAVVHPVTYMRMRGGGGATVRNLCVLLVWKLTLVYSIPGFLSAASVIDRRYDTVSGLVASVTPAPLVVYCSVRALCALVRPKPGEGGEHRKQIDQSKYTTIYTLAAILGALLLRLMVQMVTHTLHLSSGGEISGCTLVLANLCAALPSSLVLPLLFLHRAKRLPVG